MQLIGTTEVSLCASTRSGQPFLQPPPDCVYVCNMAVAPALRCDARLSTAATASVLVSMKDFAGVVC